MDMAVGSPRKRIVELMRATLERRADPYEGADLTTSRRFQAGLLGLCGLLTLAFLPFEPVDDQIGDIGWLLAAVLGLAGVGSAALVARREPSFDDLLVIAYVGIAAIAFLNFLAGGGSSAYEDLFVLWVASGAAHPPRRAFAHMATMLAALALPLLYEGTSTRIVSDMAAEALILITIGSLLIAYLTGIRRQRVGMRAGAEVERRLARVDQVTGLGNRRAFDELLTVEMARAARESSPLTVGLVDIDNLRRINDSYGHLEGDRCLGEVARTMERSVRGSDRCFRWGGDEFVVVLADTDRRAAGQILARMAHNVAGTCEGRDGRGIELTWGTAQLDPGGSAEDLLAAADVALLEAKTEKRR
jgi:diguanylate cyclase (GGDEF)-like protein